jgi:uncharacterized membrane protein
MDNLLPTIYKGFFRLKELLREIACAGANSPTMGSAAAQYIAPPAAYPQGQEKRVKTVLARPLISLQRNVLAGIITIGPLFVTYLIFSFLLGELAKAGLPMVQLLAVRFPRQWLNLPWLQSVLAILLTLAMLYIVGRVTSLVIGRQAFSLFEAVLERLPFIAKIYTSVRQLVDSMMAKNESGQRVVLVDFPIAGQKSIGFLTRVLTDAAGGGLAAQCHQPYLGVFADSADFKGDRYRPEHGASHEYADDRRGRESRNHPIHTAGSS